MAILWLLLIAAVAVAGYFFSVQNTQPVDLVVYRYVLTGLPLWLLVVAPAIAGLLLGLLLGVPARVRTALARRRVAAQIAQRDKTIDDLEHQVAKLQTDIAHMRRRGSMAPEIDEPATLPEVPDTTSSTTTTPTARRLWSR